MSPPHEMTDADRRFERDLARLRPAPCPATPEALILKAHLAAQRRRTRAWQAVAATLAAGLVVSFWARPHAPPAEPLAQVQAPVEPAPPPAIWPTPSTASAARAEGDYLRLRDAVLREGVDALPAPPSAVSAEPPLTLADTRRPVVNPPSRAFAGLMLLLSQGDTP